MAIKDDANLNDTVAKKGAIEYSDTWTDEDLQDLSTFALSHSENPHETDTKIYHLLDWIQARLTSYCQTTSAKLLRVRANHQ